MALANRVARPGNIQHDSDRPSGARTEALSIGEAADDVIGIVVRTAGLIDEGSYGVDPKEVDDQCCIIEISDNPNEDGVPGDGFYREGMGVFDKRINALREMKPGARRCMPARAAAC